MVGIQPGHECTSRKPPAVGQELARSKFLISVHVSMCVHVCNALLFCSHAVLRIPVCLKNINDLDLCVFSPTTKVRIEEEEGSWEFP